MTRSKAQRAAEARYDKKRKGVAVTIRLSDEEAAWLESNQLAGESRSAAIKRLAGLSYSGNRR